MYQQLIKELSRGLRQQNMGIGSTAREIVFARAAQSMQTQTADKDTEADRKT